MMTTPRKHSSDTADAVIREVQRTKERLAREHGYDVRRIAAAARAQQKLSGHDIVSRSGQAT